MTAAVPVSKELATLIGAACSTSLINWREPLFGPEATREVSSRPSGQGAHRGRSAPH